MKIQIKALDKLMVLDLPEKDSQVLFLKLADVALKFLSKKEIIQDEAPCPQVTEVVQTYMQPDNQSTNVDSVSPALEEAEDMDVEYGYFGFLHIQCAKCGATSTFCSKQEITQFHCKECGTDTKFKAPLAKVYLECECGKRSSYHTNSTANLIEIPCVDCKNPVTMEYNKKLGVYQTIK